jgi:hypothetical protein
MHQAKKLSSMLKRHATLDQEQLRTRKIRMRMLHQNKIYGRKLTCMVTKPFQPTAEAMIMKKLELIQEFQSSQELNLNGQDHQSQYLMMTKKQQKLLKKKSVMSKTTSKMQKTLKRDTKPMKNTHKRT